MTTASDTTLDDAAAPVVNAKPLLLVVDDEEGPRHSLRMVFRQDFDVHTVESAEKAAAFARTRPVNVAILDIRMSGGSGLDALHSLKEINPTTEVIMLTAYETLETARQALRLGACDYLSKPFDLATIRAAAARALQLHNISQSLVSASDRLRDLNSRLGDVSVREEMARTTTEIYASVMHDINNPLTVISGHVELLSAKLKRLHVLHGRDLEEVRGDIATISKQVAICHAIAARYLRFAHRRETSDKTLPLAQVFSDLRTLLRAHPAMRPHSLEATPCEADLETTADASDLLQILINLVVNGLQSSASPQTVTVSAAPADDFPRSDPAAAGREWQLAPPADQPLPPLVAISVRDQGQGIAPDVLPHIFEPYYTTKRHDGTGLGLAIVSRLVQTHRGGIHLITRPGNGTTVTIYLPRKE
ncbi:MAG: hybrid sensor histidine kinase/response regulator [Verrucomicrobiota bacterium]